MLLGHDVSGLWREFAPDFATPGAVFKCLTLPAPLLNRRDVPPSLVVARTVAMMQRIKDAQIRIPCGIQNLQHIRNTLIGFCNSFNPIPHLAAFGNEIVVWIDYQKCSDLFFMRDPSHDFLPPISYSTASESHLTYSK